MCSRVYTVGCDTPLRSGQQVSEELLGVFGLGHGLTQAVDEDGRPAVGLQHRAEQPLQEDKELLGLRRRAHLVGERQEGGDSIDQPILTWF